MAEKADAGGCVGPAAVSDLTPTKKAGKIPSRDGVLSLDLQPTPKVLNRFRKGAKKALVGFKAEAGVSEADLKARAMALVKEADVDFVVANDISKVKGDTTSITIFDRKGRSETFEGSKALAAERVWRGLLPGVRGGGGLPPGRPRGLRGPSRCRSPGGGVARGPAFAGPPGAPARPGS